MLKDSASLDGDSTKSKSASRPDLSQSTSAGGDSERILTSLKSPGFLSGSNNPVRKTSFITLTFFILAALLAAFMGYRYWATQTDSRPGALKVTKNENIAAPAKANVAEPEKVVRVEPPYTAESSAVAAPAAQIVNEAQAPASNAQAKLTDALEKDVKPPKAALQKALESKPKQAQLAESKGSAKPVARKLDQKPDQKPAQKLAQKSDQKSAQKSGTTTAVAPKATASTGDKDINLIAALLAHNAANPTSKNVSAAKPVSTSAVNAPLKSANDKNASDKNLADASIAAVRPDVVEAALKQCQGLDLLQRELCRLKVCDKMWESNPACKASLSAGKQ